MNNKIWQGKVYAEILDLSDFNDYPKTFYFNALISKKDPRNTDFVSWMKNQKNIRVIKDIDSHYINSYYIINCCVARDNVNVIQKKAELQEHSQNFLLNVDFIENTGFPKNGTHCFLVKDFEKLDEHGYFVKEIENIYEKYTCYVKREELNENNFFDINLNKSSIPRIAVVTNGESRAYIDVKFELGKAGIIPDLFDVEKNYSNLEYRLLEANKQGFDFIILCRGGGFFMDFFVFWRESLIKCLIDITKITPVITGLGHATDISFADMVASYCASTPSAAAIRLRNFYLLQPLLKAGTIDKNLFDALCS